MRRIDVPSGVQSRSMLPRVDHADAFVTEVEVQRRTAEGWARLMLQSAPTTSRATLLAGWSALGLELRPGAGTLLGWSIVENTPDHLLLAARSRLKPGLSAELLAQRRADDLLFCTFVTFGSRAARALWSAVEPIHVRVVPEMLEDARARVGAGAG